MQTSNGSVDFQYMEAEQRTCQNCKQDFTIEPDEFGLFEKVHVPPPTFCPDCRAQRRLVWRNNISLYSGVCELCKKSVITTYAPDSGIIIYCNKCWWSDKWDPMSYGADYDFSKPFFEQFKELMHRTPHIAIVNDDGIASLNSEYTYDNWFAKNCYMVFSGWRSENSMYSFYILAGKDIMDCFSLTEKNDWVYECTDCERCYQVKNSQFAIACTDSQFLYDCRSSNNCFMCAGLRNRKYCFKNEEYSKEDYEKIVAEYRLDTWEGAQRAQKEYDEFILSYPRKYAYIVQCLNSTGDIISNCKNSKACFNASGAENCRYYDYGIGAKDSQDFSMSGELSECYEGAVLDHSQQNRFGVFTVKSQDVRYTQHCHSSKYLFGCVSIRNGKYCILNKQYTKEEYEVLVPQIIAHMNDMPYIDALGREYRYGEFFPIELSPFGYNETIAHGRFPLTKEVAISNGYPWQDSQQRTTGKETVKPEDIPKTISEIPDAFTKEVLACTLCGRNYKIVPQELTFLRKMNLPIPQWCFHCRHAARNERRNPFTLWHRACMCTNESHEHSPKDGQVAGACTNEFETSYAPERQEIIYCEACYQKEIN